MLRYALHLDQERSPANIRQSNRVSIKEMLLHMYCKRQSQTGSTLKMIYYIKYFFQLWPLRTPSRSTESLSVADFWNMPSVQSRVYSAGFTLFTLQGATPHKEVCKHKTNNKSHKYQGDRTVRCVFDWLSVKDLKENTRVKNSMPCHINIQYVPLHMYLPASSESQGCMVNIQ